MELSTLIGLVLGFGSIMLTVVLEGGSLGSLLNLPAAVVVGGGTLGATMICHVIAEVLAIPNLLRIALFPKPFDLVGTVNQMVETATVVRREGILILEQIATENKFLKKAFGMIVDGLSTDHVRETLETEIDMMRQRHDKNAKIFETLGAYAPTLGIIGTVMGLVNVLGNLEDSSKLGHSIATAFIATLYGVASANLFSLPIAAKLKKLTDEEALWKEIMMEGALAIQSGDNPHIIATKLNSYLLEKDIEKGTAARQGAEASAA